MDLRCGHAQRREDRKVPEYGFRRMTTDNISMHQPGLRTSSAISPAL